MLQFIALQNFQFKLLFKCKSIEDPMEMVNSHNTKNIYRSR